MTDALTKTTSSPFIDALHAELRAILDAPLTQRSLKVLAQTAMLAQRMLALRDPKGALKTRVGLGGGYISGINLNSGFDSIDAEYDQDSEGVNYSPLAGSSSAETFGATALRELIPILKNQNKREPSVKELLDASKAARESGDVELAETIRKRALKIAAGDEAGQVDDLDALDPPPPQPYRGPEPFAPGSKCDCGELAAVSKGGKLMCLGHYDVQAVSAPLEAHSKPDFSDTAFYEDGKKLDAPNKETNP